MIQRAYAVDQGYSGRSPRMGDVPVLTGKALLQMVGVVAALLIV